MQIQHIAISCYHDEPCFRNTTRFCLAAMKREELGLWNGAWGMGQAHVHELPLRCVKDWVRNGPSLKYAKKKFENNSTSMPQIGYLMSIVFKSPGPNMAPPTFWDHVIYCLRNWVARRVCLKAVIVQTSNGFRTWMQKRFHGVLI